MNGNFAVVTSTILSCISKNLFAIRENEDKNNDHIVSYLLLLPCNLLCLNRVKLTDTSSYLQLTFILALIQCVPVIWYCFSSSQPDIILHVSLSLCASLNACPKTQIDSIGIKNIPEQTTKIMAIHLSNIITEFNMQSTIKA